MNWALVLRMPSGTVQGPLLFSRSRAVSKVTLRIPRDGGHDSMLMAGSIPQSSRTPFHGDGGQYSILMADTLAVF